MKLDFKILILLIVSFFLGYSLIHVGISQDEDGLMVYQIGQEFIESGRILQSRTWGFPLFEIPIYNILKFGGLFWAKFYCLVFYIASVWVFYRCLQVVSKNEKVNFFLTLAFLSSPYLIISGSSLMETSQGLCFALLSILFLLKHLYEKNNTFDFVLSVLFAGLSTATRPDYVILGFSIFLVKLLFDKKPSFKTILLGLFYWSIVLLPFLLYTDFRMPLNLVNHDSVRNKIIKIVLIYISLFGLFTSVLFLFYFKTLKRKIDQKEDRFFAILIFVLFCLYSVRLWLIPDEVEYIIILFPIVLIFLSTRIKNWSFTLLLFLCISLPNFFQVHFFERDFFGELSVKPGISKGALFQEKQFRLQNEYVRTEIRKDISEVARNWGIESYFIGASKVKNITIFLPSQNLRAYIKGREDPKFYENFNSQTIFTYALPLHKGWKQFIAFTPFKPISEEKIYEVIDKEPFRLKKK